MGAVRINQMGYSLSCVKQVLYVGKGDTFFVYQAENHELISQGRLIEKGFDAASGDFLCVGDFNTLIIPGSYYIKVNNDSSTVFTVSEDRNVICTDALLKAFYYQRCGIELTEQYAGSYKHPVCHLQPSYLFCQNAEELLQSDPDKLVKLDTVGGWHDAGDYGRYTVASVKTIVDLLLAYEHYRETFVHSVGIPENGTKEPDILKEVRIGLDFLFKMQRADGAAYTKAATRYFSGTIMPELDLSPIFVFDISSPATAGFTAVMAMAAKIYEEFDPVYANKCLLAAERAYDWCKLNPEPLLFKNPQDIRSGEYGDFSDIDERYWAAAQLYRTTGEEKYHSDFIMYYAMLKDRFSFGWRSVGGYGSVAYLFSEHPVKQDIYKELKNEWLDYAGKLSERSSKDGYGITLDSNEYVWGSLMVLMNHSIQLIIADRLMKTSSYQRAVQYSWDYLFGRNPMDISYVTGLGEHSVMNPHHRPSASDGVKNPVPGLVAGGPCAALLDEITREQCQGLPPAKCYVDHEESFSSNEIDIYWNSPAVYVGAYLCSFL